MAADDHKLVFAAAAVVVLCILAVDSMPMATAALDCNDVQTQLSPCLSYVSSTSTQKPTQDGRCCQGVKGLVELAATKADRQVTCGCLKQLAGTPGLDQNKAQTLPGDCGVHIPYKINVSTDCNE